MLWGFMHDYRHFIIPLIEETGTIGCTIDCSSPLEEELWLISKGESRIDWEIVAIRSKTTHGLKFLYGENDLINAHQQIPESSYSSKFRYFTSFEKGTSYFVMEHPSLVTIFDQIGESGQEPVLAKPSLFSHWYGKLIDASNLEVIPSIISTETVNDGSIEGFIRFLKDLLRSKPSDWHLEPRKNACLSRLRHNGQMSENSEFSAKHGQWLTNSLMTISGIEGHAPNTALDGAFTVPGEDGTKVSLRVSLIPSLYGYSIVCRFLYPGKNSCLSLEKLGVHTEQEFLINKTYQQGEGLWLICGPTGSGKTTTLHSLLQISVSNNMKVLAVEDPVERTIPGVQHVQVNHKRGVTFAAALKSFMRQAPDSILIGEIRDPATAAVALQASFTGHQVLASIHARNNPGILNRLEDLHQDCESVKSAVKLVIHQRLIPTLCKVCKTPEPIPEEVSRQFPLLNSIPVGHLTKANGCDYCIGGFSGRTGIFCVSDLSSGENTEKVLQNEAMNLLLSGRTSLKGAVSFLPEVLRPNFLFHNCKDFANYQLAHTR